MPDDVVHLRAAIDLACIARATGNAPYGARLVADDDTVLAESGNTVSTSRDVTAHAEMCVLRKLPTDVAVERLSAATLYASAEPCAMCAAAIAWSGVGRVVYAVESRRVRELDGPAPTEPGVSGVELMHRTERAIRVEGGLLAEEAERSLWPEGAR